MQRIWTWQLIGLFPLVFSAEAADADALFVQRENLAKLRAMDLFPEVEKEGSKLHRAVAEEVARLEIREPSIFNDANWPVRVARWVAARMKIRPRSFHEIMNDQSRPFRLDWKNDPYFDEVVIYGARYGVPGRMFEVTEAIVEGMTGNHLKVKADDTLLPMLSGGGASPRRRGESDRDFWRRQQDELTTSEVAESKKERVLTIEYEFRGEKHSCTVRRGEVAEIPGPDAEKSTGPSEGEAGSRAKVVEAKRMIGTPRMRTIHSLKLR